MHRNIPPLNAIRAFEAVARHEHLGHAADELNVTHSAVSQQIKHIEEWFEQELFSRVKGRLYLNSAGQELLKGYGSALDLMQNTTDLLLRRGPGEHMTLHCDPAFLSKVIMPLGDVARSAASGVTLDVKTASIAHTAFPDAADIVIDHNQHRNWHNVHREHLLDIHGFPACAPSLLERYPPPTRPLDLRRMPLLHGADRDSWNSWLVEFAGSTSAGCANTYYDDFSMTINAAVRGRGAILADPVLCEFELETGQLVPLFNNTIHEVSYYAFCTNLKYSTRTVRRAFDSIVEILRTHDSKIRALEKNKEPAHRPWEAPSVAQKLD
ncbi:LysR family transcriptional regulator [Shimia haliotis]|uniref:LysR family transcriptional regulator, glycine cleavage system transcriptional activator n=1 Tax=Shimia haliotis TaxID=1280847 RepID=A0A1I4GF45_9RHOB|nr:LysR family transcriptional regulator [Shimia haliotis]SFL28678.1 LysR family transcriptional regulator, glycine cleavage system transcriptional activator [Shimia haliotis]